MSNLKATGKWTRDKRNKRNEKSIINYIIVSNNMLNRIEEMIVDEKGTYRIKKRSDTDHNTILTTIKIKNVKEGKTIKRWKLDSKAGWKQFNQKIQEKSKPKPQNTKNYKR